VGAFPVWRPNLDELDVDSAPASAFLIPKSFKIIPLQLGCRVPARVLACLLSDGPVLDARSTRFPTKSNSVAVGVWSARSLASHDSTGGSLFRLFHKNFDWAGTQFLCVAR
jgi:hypothetical protein